MKKIITLLSFLAIVIIACNTYTKTNGVLSNPDDMPADEYTITVDRDTTLMTKNGALLKIPGGSLSTDDGNTVTLEIKEAYSIEQMIKAGLTTQSNGELLSSGGMIYINAKGGQNVTIKQAIKVAVPSNYLNKDMQLFNGEKDAKGNINWIKPAPLPENKQLTAIDTGRILFERSCAPCHSIGKDATGPNLAHFLKRFSGDTLLVRGYALHLPYLLDYVPVDTSNSSQLRDKLVHINSELWQNQYLYFCNLKAQYGSLGTGFPDLDEEALTSIYRYIQNESDRQSLPLPSNAYLDNCIDSCYQYLLQTRELLDQKNALENKREKLVEDNGPMVKEKKTPATPPNENLPSLPPPPDLDEKVSPKNYGAVYYQFTIETFGWFNIDVLVKGLNGVEESELFVRIVGQYREKIQVYLIIPSAKVYVQGGPAERNEEEFAFLYKNGKIALPQGAKAYIMAVTEIESSIAFALKEFTTGLKQEFDISLQQSTKETFNAAISSLNAGDIKISVDDSKNAADIRKSDADLKTINENLKKAESLKPKNCDCSCGNRPDSNVVNSSEIILPLDAVVYDKIP